MLVQISTHAARKVRDAVFGRLVQRCYDRGLLCTGARDHEDGRWEPISTSSRLRVLQVLANGNAGELDRVLKVNTQDQVCVCIVVVPEVVDGL